MLNQNDLSSTVQSNLYTQEYGSKPHLEGVQVISIKHLVTEEGDFSEIMRLDETGHLEGLPEFQVRQVSRSCIFPGSIKGWHIHYQQDDLWYVPPQDQLLVGLWDVRQGSPTEDQTMKINLGGGHSKLVFIPRGVAHGCVNHSPTAAQLFYAMNQQFNAAQPDEQRLPWDSRGADFWQPERD